MATEEREYLRPYVRAVSRHGAGFGSLLWASPQTQEARFKAILRLCSVSGAMVLDVGCGRADLLDYMLKRGLEPEDYVGIEAMAELVRAARRKRHPRCTIIEADFVAQPQRMLVGADVVILSGSLNTLDGKSFYATLRTAYAGATKTLVFNFLSSAYLAAKDWLIWQRPEEVLAFAQRLGGEVRMLDDYLPGDCTIAVHRPAGREDLTVP